MALTFAHVLQQAGASDDNRIAGLHGSRSELPYSEIEGYYRQNSLLEAKLSGKPHAPRLSLTLNEGVQRENHSPLLQPVLTMQGPLGQSGWAVNSLSVGIAHPPAVLKNVRAAFDILSKFDLAERLHQAFNPIAVAATTALNEHFLSRVELNLMNRKRSGYLVSEP
jgi:hypothetical protein